MSLSSKVLPIFISINNDIKVIIKWIVSGKFHDKEKVERAIIEKKEEEKMDLMEAQKND